MAIHSLILELSDEPPYTSISRELGDDEFDLWCNRSSHVLEYRARSSLEMVSGLRRIRTIARRQKVRISRSDQVGPRTTMLVTNCTCSRRHPSPSVLITDRNCIDLMPTTYRGGWARHRIIGFRNSDLRRVVNALRARGSVRVIARRQTRSSSMRESIEVSVADLFAGLTTKQRGALLAAIRGRYYGLNTRGATTDQIARSIGVPGSTFREHLRKAEAKLILGAHPYLLLADDT